MEKKYLKRDFAIDPLNEDVFAFKIAMTDPSNGKQNAHHNNQD